jgi:gas vesicle protein
MSFFNFIERKLKPGDIPGTGYQPKPSTGKQVAPPPKNPNSSSTALERTLIMSNAKQEAVKAITKEHKDKIKLFHNEFTKYVKEFKDFLISEGRSETDEDVINTLKGILGYLKTYKNLTIYELESLCDNMLQEDPVQELTKDAYNLIKKIIVDNSHDLSAELIKNIKSFISDSGYSVQVSRKNMLAIADIINVTVSRDVFSTIQLMDEEIVTVETDSMEDLKKENASLKAELEAYKKAIADVKKKFS